MSKMLRVTTISGDGKRTVAHVPMSAEMQRLSTQMAAAWDSHGCKCVAPHPDHIECLPRGHSVDVICTDCGGWRQIG